MKLYELLDRELLQEMQEQGYVRSQEHPVHPYTIFNYTEKAQYQNLWNDVTKACRGLIWDRRLGEIVARPFPKFLNYSQHDPDDFEADELVEITDKIDGSLGIIFYNRYSNVWEVATRGSFTSDQALWATDWLSTRQHLVTQTLVFKHRTTLLAEIVYPSNRIVLDYGKYEGLIYLGSVDISGKIFSPNDGMWNGDKTKIIKVGTFNEVHSLQNRENAEGVVVRFIHRGKSQPQQVKFKQDDYVALHRIVTGLSKKSIWEILSTGEDIAESLSKIPDELIPWAEDVVDDLNNQYDELFLKIEEDVQRVFDVVGENPSRKEFAIEAKKYPTLPYIFLYVDGNFKKLQDKIWSDIEPRGDSRVFARSS